MRRGKSTNYADEYEGGDDDDYDYDQDDYGYEEEYDDEGDYAYRPEDDHDDRPTRAAITATSSKGASKQAPVPATSTAAKKQQPAAKNSSPAPDEEILVAMEPLVLAALEGTAAARSAVADIRAALRTANYDVDVTVAALLTEAEHVAHMKAQQQQQPQTQQQHIGAAIPKAPAAPVSHKSTGKVLSIGGKKPANTAAAASGAASPAPAADIAISSSVAASGVASPMSPPPPLPGNGGDAAAAVPAADRALFDKRLEDVVTADGKPHISAVIAGHVDHGKSTILGHLLVQLGEISERDVAKLEAQAKATGKASFGYAWVLDQSDEERRRGITIDAGVQAFQTDDRVVAILDAPGHRDFIENMVASTAQADSAVLVVSAVPNELEAGLGNSTKEHATILRALGISQIIVAVNKMDAVDYDQSAFEAASERVRALLRSLRYKDEEVLAVVPVSGLSGVNLTRAHGTLGAAPAALSSWYTGPTLIDCVNRIAPVKRMLHFPTRFVVTDVGKGTLTGRMEAGTLRAGDTLLLQPGGAKNHVVVRGIDHPPLGAVREVNAGDSGVELTSSSDLSRVGPGSIGCAFKAPCVVGTKFRCRVQTFGTLAKVILPGSTFMMQLHAVLVPVTVVKLLSKMDMRTGAWSPEGAMVKLLPKDTQGVVVLQTEQPIACERFEDCKPLGRFVLRQEGETVGGGLIEDVVAE